MEINVEKGDLLAQKADLLVVNCLQGAPRLNGDVLRIDRILGGVISRLIKEEKFKGKLGETLLIRPDHLVVKRLLLVGLGEEEKINLEVCREAAAVSLRSAEKLGARKVVSVLPGFGYRGLSAKDCGRTAVEGVRLAAYKFETYKKERTKAAVAEFVFVLNQGREAKAAAVGAALAELGAAGTALARDLVNTPSGNMTPAALVEAAKRIVKESRGVIKMKVFDESALRRLGAGGLLGVGQGADHPPVLVHLRYTPVKAKKRVAIVGKAITFDSGGLSLKPAEAMYSMKCDMAGAAAVLGLFHVLPRLKPRLIVDGIFGACENMPSGRAIRPGDVVKTLNGKTIEVLHTDAEGRVTLADTLAYAVRQKPNAIIDLATLTGACMVALGEEITGLMSNDSGLARQTLEAAKAVGEKIWELPLDSSYKKELKSDVADYRNITGKYGGALTAGLLLSEFVGRIPWVHLDIAGPAFAEREINSYTPKGATGVGVRTLIEFIRTWR